MKGLDAYNHGLVECGCPAWVLRPLEILDAGGVEVGWCERHDGIGPYLERHLFCNGYLGGDCANPCEHLFEAVLLRRRQLRRNLALHCGWGQGYVVDVFAAVRILVGAYAEGVFIGLPTAPDCFFSLRELREILGPWSTRHLLVAEMEAGIMRLEVNGDGWLGNWSSLWPTAFQNYDTHRA